VKLAKLESCDHNITILKTRPNHWYVCVLKTTEPPVFENATYKSVFLDPGERSFQTFYSPDGICGKIGGEEFNQKLNILDKKLDLLHGLSAKAASKRKRNIKKRMAKIRLTIRNLVQDLHWQTAAFLCDNFQNIFLPRFEVSKMVKGSPLGSGVSRKLLQLSHGDFKQKMIYYAKTKHRNLYIVGEEYSTKTCGSCGHIQVMEAKKTFDCEHCKARIDRDYNGARNICLKLLSKFI
jgi:putative transposase